MRFGVLRPSMVQSSSKAVTVSSTHGGMREVHILGEGDHSYLKLTRAADRGLTLMDYDETAMTSQTLAVLMICWTRVEGFFLRLFLRAGIDLFLIRVLNTVDVRHAGLHRRDPFEGVFT